MLRNPPNLDCPRPLNVEAIVQTDIDALIRRADRADNAAVEELFALLYAELHRVAESALRRDGFAPRWDRRPFFTKRTQHLGPRRRRVRRARSVPGVCLTRDAG